MHQLLSYENVVNVVHPVELYKSVFTFFYPRDACETGELRGSLGKQTENMFKLRMKMNAIAIPAYIFMRELLFRILARIPRPPGTIFSSAS